MAIVEVFADITCPFTHVGLNRVVAQLASLGRGTDILVRAWPLEWVNGTPLDAAGVAEKIAVLNEELGVDDFGGFSVDVWPDTTIPALNLAAQAAAVDMATGLRVSRALRAALFVDGRDVADDDVLADIAGDHGLESPARDPLPQVLADYEEGQRRGVRCSPDFWVGTSEFFCPALNLTRDDEAHLHSEIDPDGLRRFIEAVTS